MTTTKDPALVELMACPRCAKPLFDAPPLRCVACQVDFPDVADVPWLFAEPTAALAQWRQRLHHLLRKTEADLARTRQALRAAGVRPLTRQRLNALADGQTQHLGELARLLTPLQLGELTASLETHLALRTRLPPAQGLTTYYANLHRDWCWGDAENAAAYELVTSVLPAATGAKILVLGSGGGRLAYDLHMGLEPAITIALDINPLLALASQQIIHGAALQLHEFPLAPRSLTDVAVPRVLSAPRSVTPGYVNVLADALRAPFASDAFDVVVTPWFIDIVAEPLHRLAQRINRLLRPGGSWVIFGSLAFSGPDPGSHVSREELAEIISDAGFSDPEINEATIPYMCSPASRHGRQEQVLAVSAAKRKRAAAAPRHTALPDWLVQANRPVPLIDSFRMQATTTRIYAFMMSMIDGQRSIADMAGVMEQQRLMPRAEAESAIRSFLIKMYDESQAAESL